MISRSDMRMLITAAKRGNDTPVEQQIRAFADVREVLNSADSTERECETALATINDMEAAGWVEHTISENVLR